MSSTSNEKAPTRFQDFRSLRNHWSRPIGPRAYYWYLTFENAPELRARAREYQQAITYPYYDKTPLCYLHLTLDRIAFANEVSWHQISAIESAALSACRKIRHFDITVGNLGGTRGAIGFGVYPDQPIRDLRDSLRAATLSAYPDAPVDKGDFRPHITIAYANTDGVPADEMITRAEQLDATTRQADVTVREGSLVLLERSQRSYSWHAISRVPLAGSAGMPAPLGHA